MPTEIEFKWLSLNPSSLLQKIRALPEGSYTTRRIFQSYFNDGDIAQAEGGSGASLRIRTYQNENTHIICTKRRTGLISCEENEFAVPKEIAMAMHQKADSALMKTRYCIRDGDNIWEVDVFEYVINNKSIMNPQNFSPYYQSGYMQEPGKMIPETLIVIELEVEVESDEYNGVFPSWIDSNEIKPLDMSNQDISRCNAKKLIAELGLNK